MDAAEQKAYLYHVFRKMSRSFMRSRPESTLRPSEVGVLWILAHAQEDAMYPSQISESMGIQRPSLTPLLRDLEEKGMIERRGDPTDGRRCRIALTEHWRTLHRQLTDQQSERFNEMLDVLDDQELGQLLAITKKLEQTVPLGGEQGPCRKEDL